MKDEDQARAPVRMNTKNNIEWERNIKAGETEKFVLKVQTRGKIGVIH